MIAVQFLIIFVTKVFGEIIFPEDVETFYDSSKSYFDLRLKSISSNDLCNRQLEYFNKNFDERNLWARVMRDAWGNVPSGIFSGNVFDFGNFDQCIDLKHYSEEVGEITGQHCTLMIPFERDTPMMGKITVPTRSSKINLGIGICVPASCPPEDVKNLVDNAMQQLWNVSTSTYEQSSFCSVKRKGYNLNGLTLFAIVFFATFIFLVVCSTVYEVFYNALARKKNPICCIFSIYTNSKTIMTMKCLSTKEMAFLHGIRSLAIILIVLGHTYAISFWNLPMINANAMLDMVKLFPTTVLFSGYFGVDTFFMLTAMLLTLSCFLELQKSEKINIPLLYLKRYIRITVPLIACVIFTLGFLTLLGDGPLWNFLTTRIGLDLCMKNWWSTLLYIGNLATPGQLCFGHSWFLMVDMQLYILSPALIYGLWKLRKRNILAISLIFLIASISVIYVLVVFLLMKFRVSLQDETSPMKDVMVHTMTLSRVSPWMMGVLVGYILHKIEGKTVEISRTVSIIAWLFSLVILLTLVFGQYPLLQENYRDYSYVGDAIYSSLKSLCWCLAMAWIIIACLLSADNVIRRFLSLSIWFPISKLSFCIYLMHIPIQFIYLSSMRTPLYFTHTRAFFKFFGDFGMAFVVAFGWALVFEFPTLNLIAIWMRPSTG